MFAHAGDITKPEPDDHQRERPLHFCAVVAEPEQAKCDYRRRDHCANRQPGEMSFVRSPTPRFATIIHARWWQAPPTRPLLPVVAGVAPATTAPLELEEQPARLQLQSQSILLQSPIECAATQPERFRRLSRISTGPGERFLN